MTTNVSYASLLKTRGFIQYIGAEFLSAFSDNILKFFLMFFVVSLYKHDRELSAAYISLIGVLFVAPYLLFLGYAGQVADKYSKRQLFIWIKLAEIAITSFLLIGFISSNLWLLLIGLFLMMTRSCFFFPVKNGLLPEILESQYLSIANSVLWMSVFIAAIIGALAGGIIFQWCADKHWLAGIILIVVAGLGYWISHYIPDIRPDSVEITVSKIRKNPFIEIWNNFGVLYRRKALFIAILGIGWFWFFGALLQTIIPVYGRDILMVDETWTSFLQGFIALGIASGCALAGWMSKDAYEPGLVPFGALGIAVGSLWASFSTSYASTAFALTFTGASAGVFIIPIYTFLHQRAKGGERGRIFAIANYVDTIGMLLASGVYWIFSAGLFVFSEKTILLVFGVCTLLITGYALKTLPIFFFRVVNFVLTRCLYKIKVEGLENVPEKGGVILVPNHVSYVDGLLIWSACRKRNIMFMIYHAAYNLKVFKWLFDLLQYIPVYEGKRVNETFDIATKRLKKGGTICIFPEGELTRTGNMNPFRRGVEKLISSVANHTNVTVVPVYIDQIWGSIFTYEGGKFFFKMPHEIPSQIKITFGPPLAATSTKEEMHQAVSKLGYESAIAKDSIDASTLASELCSVAQKNWFAKMFVTPQSSSKTYGSLFSSALSMAFRYKQTLAKHSKIAIISSKPSYESLIVHIALTLLGKTIVSSSVSNLTQMKEATQFTFAFSETPLKDCTHDTFFTATAQSKTILRFISSTVLMMMLPNSWICKMLSSFGHQPVASILYDEQSKKMIELSHKNIISHARSLSQLFFMDRSDWILSSEPSHTLVGHIGHIWYPLLNVVGIAATDVPPEKLSMQTLTHMINQYKITVLLNNKAFYTPLLESKANFKSIRFAVSLLNSTDISSYAEHSEIQLPLYEGLSVPGAPLCVTINHPNYKSKKLVQLGNKEGSIGKALPGTFVQVLDSSKQSLPHQKSGELCIKGANISTTLKNKDEWLHSGLKALIDEDGFIFLV